MRKLRIHYHLDSYHVINVVNSLQRDHFVFKRCDSTCFGDLYADSGQILWPLLQCDITIHDMFL